MAHDEDDQHDRDYDPDHDADKSVGYKRPPKSGQFKPGQSGNRAGRPSTPRTKASLLGRTLDRKRPVTIDGETKTLTNFEILCTTMMEQALAGDHRARGDLLRYADKFGYEPKPRTFWGGVKAGADNERHPQLIRALMGVHLMRALVESGRMTIDRGAATVSREIFGAGLTEAQWKKIESALRFARITPDPEERDPQIPVSPAGPPNRPGRRGP